MNDDSIARRGRAMEEAFFRDLDAQLVERLRQESSSVERRADLLRKTGLQDETLLNELVHQGITSESLVALRLVPLLMVAWADRSVSAEEKDTILAEADKMGIPLNGVTSQLLDTWLAKKPCDELIDAWKRYTALLLASMPSESKQLFLQELKRELNAVASASGGVFGFGSISDGESAMIERLLHSIS